MEVDEVLNAGRALVAKPPHDVGAALDTLIGIYIEHSLHYLSKEMWRQAMAISTQQPGQPVRTDLHVARPCLGRAALRADRKAAGARPRKAQCPCRLLGELIFNNMNMMFIEFVKDEPQTIAALRAAIVRQNRVLVEAMRRNPIRPRRRS